MKTLLPLILCLVAVPYAFAQDEDPYAQVRAQIDSCAACHGPNGARPILPEYPILAGQHMFYIYTQLKDFKAGRRENAIMQPLAAALDKNQMKLIATWFSEQQWPEHQREIPEGAEDKAQYIINSGQCPACHLGGFEGNSRVPWTRGQNPEYLAKTMMEFKDRVRKNAPDKGVLLDTFSEEDIKQLSEYIGGLPIEPATEEHGSRD